MFDEHPDRRPAIVAGASSGIGAETAKALAAGGHPVALGARRVEACEELAAAIRAEGGEAVAHRLDVADSESVADFAAYMGLSHWQAREQLKRYNEALGGMLLRPSAGTNRSYTLFWAALAKHDPDAFLEDPLEQQRRLDALEDGFCELGAHQKIITAQVGQNTRQLSRMMRRAS